jgi:signal transduction histidine kinase
MNENNKITQRINSDPRVIKMIRVLSKINKHLITFGSVGIVGILQFFFWGLFHHAIFLLYMPAIVISTLYGRGKISIILSLAVSHLITVHHEHYPLEQMLIRNFLFLVVTSMVYCLANNMKNTMEHIEKTMEIRTNFFSMVSHELKTPITALKLRHQLRLKKTNKDSEDYKFLNDNLDSIDKLTKLIRDMLDLTRIEANRLVLHIEENDITQAIQKAVNSVKMTIPPSRELVLNINSPILVKHDSTRIEQVIENLLNNAVKHGKGKIEISTYLKDSKVKIAVCDEGKLPQDKKDKLFNKFETSDVGHGGLGLGLYITKKIIEEHKGSIRVEDEDNTKFIITLPK